jgi:serine/threonine protein kinase
VDIWSIGCTFYELLTGNPLFKAANYLDLVKMMIKVLGKPSPESLKFITNEHALKYIQDMAETPKRRPTQGVKYSNELALDLIDKLLQFDPADRLTID